MAKITLNLVVSLEPKLSAQVDSIISIFTTPPLDTGPLMAALAELEKATADLSNLVTTNP